MSSRQRHGWRLAGLEREVSLAPLGTGSGSDEHGLQTAARGEVTSIFRSRLGASSAEPDSRHLCGRCWMMLCRSSGSSKRFFLLTQTRKPGRIKPPQSRSEHASKVFAQITHRLLLLVFTAHAVLGCCCHHSHGFESDDCRGHAEHVGAEGCEAAHGGAAPICPSSTEPGCDGFTAESSTKPAVCFASPNGHSHGYNEIRCRFVQRTPDGFDVKPAPVQAGFAVDGASSCNLKRTQVSGRDSDRASRARFTSSVQCCADLQSWQL